MNATAALADRDIQPADLPSLEDVRRAVPERCYERRMGHGLALVVVDMLVYAAALAVAVRTTSWVLGAVMAVVLG